VPGASLAGRLSEKERNLEYKWRQVFTSGGYLWPSY